MVSAFTFDSAGPAALLPLGSHDTGAPVAGRHVTSTSTTGRRTTGAFPAAAATTTGLPSGAIQQHQTHGVQDAQWLLTNPGIHAPLVELLVAVGAAGHLCAQVGTEITPNNHVGSTHPAIGYRDEGGFSEIGYRHKNRWKIEYMPKTTV